MSKNTPQEESFLPDDFRVESPNDRFLNKLETGTTKIRILARPAIGYSYWTEEDGVRRPHRVKTRKEAAGQKEVKQFMAFPIFNYEIAMVQIFEVTQISLLRDLESIFRDPDMGRPTDYDLKFTRTGSGKSDTKYSVVPLPPKPAEEAILQDWQEVQDNGFDLEQLFENGDPFNPAAETATGTDAGSPPFADDEINMDDIKIGEPEGTEPTE